MGKLTIEENPNGQSEEFNIGRSHLNFMIISGAKHQIKNYIIYSQHTGYAIK